MKITGYYILSLIVVSLTFFSCDNEEINQEDLMKSKDVNVTLTLAMGSNVKSREVGEEQIGNNLENYIDISQLNVFFLYGNSKVKVMHINADKESENIYKLTGDVELPSDTQDYRVMVFANCGSDIDLNDDDWTNMTFGINQNLIPMWGLLSLDNEKYELGKNYDLGTIPVVRAMAKIQLNLGMGWNEDIKIQSASLSSYNNKGYCVLKNGNQLAGINIDGDWLNPLSSNDNSSLSFTVNDDNKSAYIYLPEFENTSGLSYNINIGGNEYSFNFNPDNNDELNNIVRNHIYDYTINKADDKPHTVVTIGSWWLRKTEIWWEAKGLYEFLPNENKTINYATPLDFTFTLKLNDNSDNNKVQHGAMWTASLSNGLDFELVNENITNNKKSVWQGLARNDSYTIRVRAKKADGVARSTDLYIKVDGVKLTIGPDNSDHITITQE